MKSIRNQLLVLLFAVLTLAWILITSITYYKAKQEVKEVFDSQMAQSAAVLSHISALHINGKQSNDHKLGKEIYGHRYEKKLSFQIWENGKLTLRSVSAPKKPMASASGYSEQTINNEKWRVFTLNVNKLKTIYVAEKHEVRQELIDEITREALYPLTFALPILALLIWISLGSALRPLRRIAKEIDQRSSHNLEPVSNQDNIPTEISPILSALNSLFTQVKAAFEREKRFTADASHELRTPLASIKVQAQVALRAENDEQRQHALDQIIQGVDGTTYLVDQMLTLARLDPEVASTSFSDININDLAGDVIAEFRVRANKKHITLNLESSRQDTTIKGHDEAIAVLLRNLLSNAINYSPDNSIVTIKVVSSNDNVHLMVIDTGTGITKEQRNSVFNRFYRGDNTHHQQGSGLGLSIVKRIAELHKATVNIADNSTGKGTCIRVNFLK